MALGCCGIAPATAQGPIEVGQPVLLARYTDVQPGSCRALMAPVVTVAQAPASGRLWIARGHAIERAAGCPPQRVPVSEVWYEAVQAGPAGLAAWDVRFQDAGAARRVQRVLDARAAAR